MEPMTAVMLGAAIAGTAVQVYGTIKAANDQAEAVERKAFLDGLKADELMRRQGYNEEIMRNEAMVNEGTAGALAAESGSGNLGIGQIIRIRKSLVQRLDVSRQEAEYKAKMIRMGAEVDTTLASDIRTGATISSAGTLLTGAARAYEIASPKTDNYRSLKGQG